MAKTRAIWKFPVQMVDEFTISMPEGAQVLSAGVQHGQPFVWALVNPDTVQREDQRFRVIGTGNPIGDTIDGWCFVGTFQMMEGRFIGHLFVE